MQNRLLVGLSFFLVSAPTLAQSGVARGKAPTAPADAAASAPRAPSAPAVVDTPSPTAVSPSSCEQRLKTLKLTPLSVTEISEVCDKSRPFVREVATVCPAIVAEFSAASQGLCAALPQSGTQSELDLVSRVYQLTKLTPHAQELNPNLQNQGATPTPAAVFAQGVGSFLTAKAEQEVSAYATVELFSRVCSADDVKGVMPDTCKLLAGQDNGATPIGLGTLRRVAIGDLQALPKNLVPTALERAKTQEDKAALCVADVGFAVAGALADRKQQFVKVLHPFILRQKYAADPKRTTPCDGLWTEIQTIVEPALKGVGIDQNGVFSGHREELTSSQANDFADLLTILVSAIQALQKNQDVAQEKALRSDVIDAAVELAKALDTSKDAAQKARHDGELDDAGGIALSIWNRDWVEVVAAFATASTLSPVLLCGGDADGCQRDDKIRLLLSVIADIAVADSSDGVQSTLNRLAEPIGSWRRKFQDKFTLSLNGYAGAKYGYENVRGPTPEGSFFAPMLALGVEGSFNILSRVGIFAQVVDVGNVASVHFAGDGESGLTKVQTDPDVTIEQLFAPGGYLMLGVGKSPFVVGLGGEWVPSLRLTADGERRSAWHVGALLAVDVPLLELVHE